MKHTIALLLIVGLLATSCKKILDTEPPGSLSPTTSYSSEVQIKSALAGIYANLRSRSLYGEYYINRAVVATDETYFYNTNNGYSIYNSLSTDVEIAQVWRLLYQSINNANTMIDNIDVSAAGKVGNDVVRRAKGEALFLRSYFYFLLVQWYGDIPLQLHATADPSEGQIARTPQKVVYDQIISDMTTADSLLYDQTFSSFGYAERVTRSAVQGVLARVCLYAAGAPVNDTRRYADALQWAQKVVNSGEHTLLPSYQQVFIDAAQNRYNSETIWEVGFNAFGQGQISAVGTVGVQLGVSQTFSNGTSSAGANLYDSGYCYGYVKLHPRLYLSYEDNDLRRTWNCANYSFSNAVKVPLAANRLWSRGPAKWRREYENQLSRSTQVASATNFPLLRYSDVLLMLAEAENEVNGASQIAYDAINQVRRRGHSATSVVSTNVPITGAAQGSGYSVAPFVTIEGGGGAGATAFATITSGKVTMITITNQGSNYTSPPAIVIGNTWQPGVSYVTGTQVAAPNGKLYTVTVAGTSSAIAPINTSGASSAAVTGAVFTYAGNVAQAALTLVDNSNIPLTAGLSKEQFRAAVQLERYRELAFEALRQQDLKRWGILNTVIKSLGLDITGTNPVLPNLPAVTSELGAGTDVIPMAPVMNISDKDLYWPIPLYELNLNFRLTQNPGY